MAVLNAAPDSPQIRRCPGVMEDPWAAAGGDPMAVTFSSSNPYAPTDAPMQIDRRIDYVMVRRGAGLRAFVVDGPVDGVHPSDHAAVVVDLDL